MVGLYAVVASYTRCTCSRCVDPGDIVHLNLMGKHVVVLNSFEVAKDVLEQSKYSDRPHFTMAGELYVHSRPRYS